MSRIFLSFILLLSFSFNALAVPEGLIDPVHKTGHENCCCGNAGICQCVHAAQKSFWQHQAEDGTTVSVKAAGCGLTDEAVKVLLASRDFYFHDFRDGIFVPAAEENVLSAFYFSFPIFDQSIELPPKLA